MPASHIQDKMAPAVRAIAGTVVVHCEINPRMTEGVLTLAIDFFSFDGDGLKVVFHDTGS
jgi:hypothetical protein